MRGDVSTVVQGIPRYMGASNTMLPGSPGNHLSPDSASCANTTHCSAAKVKSLIQKICSILSETIFV